MKFILEDTVEQKRMKTTEKEASARYMGEQ